MTIFFLTVLAGALNARSTPSSSSTSNLLSPSGFFKYGDKLTAIEVKNAENSNWYRVTKCVRSNSNVSLPSSSTGQVWASAGNTGGYLRLDSTIEEPVEPPDSSYPDEIYVSLVPGGEYKTYKKEG